MSNYMKIKTFDISNGEGIRTSIFFSGCHFHCKGCFNKEAWDFDAGRPFTREVYENEIKPTINEHVSGISILGGEPLHPNNMQEVCELIEWFKHDFPDKTIWLWTGYTLNEIKSRCSVYDIPSDMDAICVRMVLLQIDVLVDGQFIEEQKDLTLKWRGSKNQRIIDVKETLKQNKIIEKI